MGSKAKITKYIVPIIQRKIDESGARYYVEPFAGGCNVIDKIKAEYRIASDSNKYLIALFQHLQDGGELPEHITREEYNKAREAYRTGDAEVTIQAVDGDLFGGLSASGLDEEGEVDYGRAFSTNAKIAAAGIIEPDLKNEQLLKHLGVATPADAAKKIFKGEINRISTEIAKLSGFENEETTDKTVKN